MRGRYHAAAERRLLAASKQVADCLAALAALLKAALIVGTAALLSVALAE
jgi:hypothetical protein